MIDNYDIANDLIRLCKISKVPELFLDRLSIQELKSIPELFTCKHLKKLTLRSNQINDFSELENLPKLEYLDLRSNRIVELKTLVKIRGLRHLNLSSNYIHDLSPLRYLTKLEYLGLSSNKINNLGGIENLINLQTLRLNFNSIENVDLIENLKNLEHLSFGDNYIEDIFPLSTILNLQTLNLSSNKLKKLPLSIFNLQIYPSVSSKGYEVGEFDLSGNMIDSPPIEIIWQGIKSVENWYEATKVNLKEIKIILIGDPKAGKTSLLRRLKNDSFDKDEVQTDGVNIEDISFGECHTFKNQKSLHNLTGHFWDFGGQEIMNATHQFFLTKRSIYVLVIDARKDQNNSEQIRHWVKKVKTTSGNSSILIIANQIDVNPGFGFENEYELKKEFPEIKYFIKASCKTNENIEIVKNCLDELIPKAELFNTKIDERWVAIKDILQKETKSNHFLDESKFLDICRRHNLKKREAQKNAINFLHDLGLVLHFDQINLSEYYVLDPYWITYGVYQILTSAFASKGKGIVDMNKLEFIINQEEDKNEIYRTENFIKLYYSNNQRRFLVDILNQFKLCFFIHDRSQFIIPDLLDTNEPIRKTEEIRNSDDSIHFVYQYDYLPKSTMPRIMVETHRILTHMWRTGCVLESDASKALVMNYKNRISIIVIGEHKKKREFMSVIRHIVDIVNKNLRDKPKMLIPLPGVDAFVDYEILLKREKRGKKYYELSVPIEKDFEISKLLEGVPSENEIKLMHDKIDKILANQTEIMNRLNGHYQYLINLPQNKDIEKEITACIKEINDEQTEEITKTLLMWLAQAFGMVVDEIDDNLKDIFSDISKTNNLQMKLKLGIPLANLLGINLETEFDIRSWATKFYQKHEIRLFKIMGLL